MRGLCAFRSSGDVPCRGLFAGDSIESEMSGGVCTDSSQSYSAIPSQDEHVETCGTFSGALSGVGLRFGDAAADFLSACFCSSSSVTFLCSASSSDFRALSSSSSLVVLFCSSASSDVSAAFPLSFLSGSTATHSLEMGDTACKRARNWRRRRYLSKNSAFKVESHCSASATRWLAAVRSLRSISSESSRLSSLISASVCMEDIESTFARNNAAKLVRFGDMFTYTHMQREIEP